MQYVAALTELSWLLAYVKPVLCVTKPNDKLVSQCAARSGSPHDDKIITLVYCPVFESSSGGRQFYNSSGRTSTVLNIFVQNIEVS